MRQSFDPGCPFGSIQSIAEIDSVDRRVQQLYQQDPDKMQKVLTSYLVSRGNQTYERWKKPGGELACKYNDGYVKNERGRPQTKGYSRQWYRRALADKPCHYLPVWDDSTKAKEPAMF